MSFQNLQFSPDIYLVIFRENLRTICGRAVWGQAQIKTCNSIFQFDIALLDWLEKVFSIDLDFDWIGCQISRNVDTHPIPTEFTSSVKYFYIFNSQLIYYCFPINWIFRETLQGVNSFWCKIKWDAKFYEDSERTTCF